MHLINYKTVKQNDFHIFDLYVHLTLSFFRGTYVPRKKKSRYSDYFLRD